MKFKIYILFVILNLIFVKSSLIQASSKVYKGISIDEFKQSKINYDEVKKDGIEIVYISSTKSTSHINPYFNQNYNMAKKSNLKVGIYHTLNAKNIKEAKDEAYFFLLNIIGTNPECLLGLKIENINNENLITIQEEYEIIDTFINTIKNKIKKDVIIYSDIYNFNKYKLDLKKYKNWIINYNYLGDETNTCSYKVASEYTNLGSVKGIDGNVDISYYSEEILNDNLDNNKIQLNFSNVDRYIIKKGDTLTSISNIYRTTIENIALLNKIENKNFIIEGQILQILD